jgi:hypothetical protein
VLLLVEGETVRAEGLEAPLAETQLSDLAVGVGRAIVAAAFSPHPNEISNISALSLSAIAVA